MRRLASLALALALFALLAVPVLADTLFIPLTLRSWPPPLLTMASGGGVYQRQPDGSVVTVFEGLPCVYHLAWAPDRARLAYVSGVESGRDIYLYDSRVGQHTRLTHGPGLNVAPAWSPDGERIAYSCAQPDGAQLCVMAADGSDQRVVTSGYHRYLTPAWSPDGARIACSMAFLLQRRICHMAADGSDIQCITDGGEYTQDDTPTWSPDGATIAFSSARSGVWSLYTVPADGGDLTKLTTDDYHAWSPSWSPDGEHIAFMRWADDPTATIVQVITANGAVVAAIGGQEATLSPAWR